MIERRIRCVGITVTFDTPEYQRAVDLGTNALSRVGEKSVLQVGRPGPWMLLN